MFLQMVLPVTPALQAETLKFLEITVPTARKQLL